MNRTPMIVDYTDWDILLRCKEVATTETEYFKSVWTGEYGNHIESYNEKGMIRIMGQVIARLTHEDQRANLFDRLMRLGWVREDVLLHELYVFLLDLQVRDCACMCKYEDLYIIDYKGRYYTISQYDDLKENENGKV